MYILIMDMDIYEYYCTIVVLHVNTVMVFGGVVCVFFYLAIYI